MKQGVKLSAILLLILVALLVIALHIKPKKSAYSNIKSFEECKAAGYPILESYPSQCSLPNGQFFVQSFVSDR